MRSYKMNPRGITKTVSHRITLKNNRRRVRSWIVPEKELVKVLAGLREDQFDLSEIEYVGEMTRIIDNRKNPYQSWIDEKDVTLEARKLIAEGVK